MNINKKLIFQLFFILVSLCGYHANAQLVLTSTGTSNAFGVTYPANISSVVPGMGITFFSNQSINGAATLNMNGTGPRSIVKNGSSPLTSGDILTGQAVSVMFDGTNYQLLSPTANSIPTPNYWTVSGTNLQPLNNTLSINLATTFGGLFLNGNTLISSNSPNVVFLGNSGSALNAGSNNLFFGVLSGSNNTTGNSNIFMGFQSGAANISGTQNVYLGEFSGFSATGSNNLFLGQNSGRNTTSAFNNIFLGSSAGSNNVTGGANIVIGALANVSLPGLSNAIAIGMNSTVGGSNMMALGGTGSAAVKVGIGTGLPQNDLHVVGGARIQNLSLGGAVFATSNGDLFVSTSSGASAWTVSGTNIFPQNLSANVG
ncbi:MAG: hypothetical protein K2Q22_01365, partial [Cytophagales bacterium]|nr:hypothetical protein [Cytophagales bacterium]